MADSRPANPIELTQELVRVGSVTPNDFGCQDILIKRLKALGFTIHPLPFGPIKNFYARLGDNAPNLCFAGHTDVVPTGPVAQWTSAPFTPERRAGILYGRGVADMKGALAAMVCATERFLAQTPQPAGSISYLITGDEEGDAADGTVRMVPWLQAHDELPDYCLVGEPSSNQQLGDTIKNGRRGSINGYLTVHGVQGHVAFPDQAQNPIHLAMAALHDLSRLALDAGDADFPPTRLQLTNIHAGEGTTNVIPGDLSVMLNLRFSPQSSPDSIDRAVRAVLDNHRLNYTLEWKLSGLPFLTANGPLTDAMIGAVQDVTGRTPVLSTGGGTSDARFIAPAGVAVAELGLINTTIHQVDECAAEADIDALTKVYEALLARLLR